MDEGRPRQPAPLGERSLFCANARKAGSVQLWEWIGDEQATTFSY